jgi:serine/threonine-protein kinase SRPK3
LRLSRQIASANPAHPGLKYIRLVQDSFTIPGPMGPHLSLVYEPMREPLWPLQRRMIDGLYSFGLLAYTVKFLLTGLDYLHNECNIIHTGGSIPHFSVILTVTLLDLKPENVLVGLEKTLSLDDIVADEINSPSPRKVLSERTIYSSRNDFGHPKSTPRRPKITDFDAAVQVTGFRKTFTHPIQPNCYRAPEVTSPLRESFL